MSNFFGQYYIDSDLCYALSKLMDLNLHRQDTAFERGYTLISSEHMSPVWMTLYEQEILECLQKYQEEFRYSQEGCAGIVMEKPYNLQHYAPNRHYSVWHCENNGVPPFHRRHLAFMTYLNTVETGGDTEFFYQQQSFTPKIGRTLIWPAYFTHTHRGIPTPDDKKIITGWFRFFDTEQFQQDTQELNDEDFYNRLHELDTVR